MKKLYFPILKAKVGELTAIKELSDEVRSSVLPILQLPEPNQPRNKPPRVADSKYISERIKAIKKSVKNMPFIFDTSLIALEPELERLIICYFFNLDLYPLIDISQSGNIYQACLKHGYSPKKICLKLSGHHISDINTPILLRQIIESLGCEETDIILLLDLEDISAVEINELAAPVSSFFTTINNEFNFNKIILGAGAFPSSLVGVVPWQYYYYQRRDWKLYKMVSRKVPDIQFGDYAINTAAISNGPAFQGPSSIRYTLEDNFVVVKGILTDPLGQPPSAQHIKLSRLIVQNEAYKGLNFSWGDKHIHRCTQPLQPNTGNHSTWRAVGTSHHVTLVVEALSKLA